ncbi:MAG: hypothetical protein M3406_16200, partial [Chloroflexota bacterium]|nr:hypothetical protein [Chloroflexota bacterium]
MGRGRAGGTGHRREARALEVVKARRGSTSEAGAKPHAMSEAASGSGEPEALSVTHWFDSGTEGEPFTATVRFSGRRVGTRGKVTPRDTFVKEETIGRVVPASGPVSVTTWVYGIQPGEWAVTAKLIRRGRQLGHHSPSDRRGHSAAQSLPRAAWSWRAWGLASGAFVPVRTRWTPLVRLAAMPAVIPGSWSALVGLGVVVGA